MVVDICQACGEEHEPPRGAKCKAAKAKTVKKVKMESPEPEDECVTGGAVGGAASVEESVDSMLRLSLGEQSDSKPAKLNLEVEPDEEEKALRRQLETRVLERRKARLRAELERDSTDEEEEQVKPRRKHKGRRKHDKCKDTPVAMGSSPSSSPSSSSSSTSSSSDSGSSRSRDRRRRRKKKRSKFALDKYTKGRKSVKKLTFNELIYAALLWGAKRASKVDMDIEDAQRYMGHLAYMAMHATTNNYTDEAYRGYDRDVREKVKERGLKALKMGDSGLSLLHFNLDNSRLHKDGRKGKVSGPKRGAEGTAGKAKGACYAFNYNKDGCTRKKCDWDHHCISCKSVDHVVESCPSKKY